MKNYLCSLLTWFLVASFDAFVVLVVVESKQSPSIFTDFYHNPFKLPLSQSAIPVYFTLLSSHKGNILHIFQNFGHPWLS